MSTITTSVTWRELRASRLRAYIFRKQVERGERSGKFNATYTEIFPTGWFQRFWWFWTGTRKWNVSWKEEPIKK